MTVPLLPAGHRSLRVLHLSDLHLTPRQTRKQDWVRGLASLRPDLVINTGDNLAHQGSVPVVRDALGALLDVPGKVLGLLGRTGSGKTTLTRLLFRLYDPDEGSICFYGNNNATPMDLRDLPLAALRSRVGLVTQEVQFFRASLRDNLTFFKADVPDAQINR